MIGNAPPSLLAEIDEKMVLDLIAQLLGGIGGSVVIIFWLCSWQLALAFAAMVPVRPQPSAAPFHVSQPQAIP